MFLLGHYSQSALGEKDTGIEEKSPCTREIYYREYAEVYADPHR